jgi:predicted ATPase/class 3 adenylate cyclase
MAREVVVAAGASGGTASPAAARLNLPTGTVTFLFTDIEGSTRLVQELGAEYAAVLGEHRRLVREAFAGHNGVEVDTQGDSFFYAFARSTDAVQAAMAAQAALAAGPVKVRMGVHTGEVLLGDEGYVGVDVHRAARICAAAHGGQVLLSAATAALVDVDLHDLGQHRLKDLLAPVHLYQVGHEDFPPLRTLDFTSLPIQSTTLIGREREIAEVVTLLHEHRLVTLVGPGGSGKTRLALQVAAEASDGMPDGVFWVPLAEVRDPRLVLPAIAEAVGITAELEGGLAGKRVLLLIDNFEQVVDAAPQLAHLLEHASKIKLLLTSREPLRISAEQEYPVLPLQPSDAVALFTARARAMDPAFNADSAVPDICDAVDGLPLAVELAAARTKVLSTDQIRDRLSHRLDLLAGRSRDTPLRQQTVRATIEWSHELLTPAERDLFARLAIFAGGWTLEAAEAICDADLELLEGLVAKNVVRHERRRFGMLELIREFATERLAQLPERDELAQRHADYFLAQAERTERDVVLGRLEAWEGFMAEALNLRLALEHFVQAGDAEREIRLVAVIWQPWFDQGRWGECQRMLQHALAGAKDPTAARTMALRGAAWAAGRQGEVAEAAGLIDEALRIARQLSDARLTARALSTMAAIEGWRVNPNRERVAALNEEALRLARSAGDVAAVVALLNNIGINRRREGDLVGGAAAGEEAVATARQAPGARRPLAIAQLNLGENHWRLGDSAKAWSCFSESLGLGRDLGFREVCVEAMYGLAFVAVSTGDHHAAATLFGAAEREGTFGYMPEDNEFAQMVRDARDAARHGLGDDGFTKAVAVGRATSIEALVAWTQQNAPRGTAAVAQGDSDSAPTPAVDAEQALSLVTALERIDLRSYTVVGRMVRFDPTVREALADARQSIAMAIEQPGHKRNTHLLWAAPGSGKTCFVQEVAKSIANARFAEINLANADEQALRAFLADAGVSAGRRLCFIDECDSNPQGFSPYELLLPVLDQAAATEAAVAFVLAGSSGRSAADMQRRMAEHAKGADLISRIPRGNVHTIAPLDIGDRLLVAASQFRAAAEEAGRHVAAVERMALFYIAVDDGLGSPRQLRELCVRAVERLLPGEERLRYDHLFSPGNPENKAFWMRWQVRHGELVNHFVRIEDTAHHS